VWGVMEMDVWVTFEPAVILGLVGREIVEDDVNGGLSILIGGHNVVHEVEKLDTSLPVAGATCRPSVLHRGENLFELLTELSGGKLIVLPATRSFCSFGARRLAPASGSDRAPSCNGILTSTTTAASLGE